MARRLLPFLGVITLLLTASGAARAGWHDTPCDSVEWQKALSCLLDFSGAPLTASFKAGDRKFLRVLLTKNSGGIVIQFVREAAGDLKLDIIDVHKDHPPYTLAVSRDAWREIESHWNAFPAARVKAEADRKVEEARNKKAGIETVCLHPWDARVETNLSASVNAIEGNSCDNIEVVNFAVAIADIALSNAPPCRLIDDRGDPFSPATLELCLQLQGDRLKAAPALNGALQLGLYDGKDRERTLGSYRRVIAPSASFDLAGNPAVTGLDAVARAWFAAQASSLNSWLSADTAYGFADRAEVDGYVWRIVEPVKGEVYSHYERAPSHQVWRVQPDGAVKLVSWSIGAFVLDPDR